MSELPRGRYLVDFLASRPEFVGIGKATAVRLWERYGNDLYAILGAGDIARLSEVLGRNQSAIVVEAWKNQQALADCVVFFDENDIDASVARKAVDFWGDEAVLKLRKNPYRLLTICPWTRVDRVALRLGLRPDDPRRQVAAVGAALYDRIDRKHTWCARGTLLKQVSTLLKVSVADAEIALDAAVADGAAIPIDSGFQPAGAAYMERYIEDRIICHIEPKRRKDIFLDEIQTSDIDAFLAGFGSSHRLTDEQLDAVRMAMRNTFSLLIGGAGVGKTTVLRAINAAARHFGMVVYQLAIAGRAAHRIAEATGQPAQTVASWLGGLANGRIEVGRHTFVVIDEASMLDLPTLYRILFYLPDNVPVLLVGDTAQLPPIGFGLTLHRLVLERELQKTELTRILRTTDTTGIPKVSVAIRNGDVPELPEYGHRSAGCSFFSAEGYGIVAALEDVVHDLDGEEVQIIAPTYAGIAGIDAINDHFHRLNRMAGHECHQGFAEGDPCIWLKNDHDRRLFNGSLGRVVGFESESIIAEFEGSRQRVDFGDLDKLGLAYCISVHKAQGSQFRNVLMPIVGTPSLDRAMLYTGVTRAVDRVVLVGSRSSFAEAVVPRPRSLERQVAFRLRHDRNAT